MILLATAGNTFPGRVADRLTPFMMIDQQVGTGAAARNDAQVELDCTG